MYFLSNLLYHAHFAWFYSCHRFAHCIWRIEPRVSIVDSSTVFTKCYGNGIILSCMFTLAGDNYTFSRYSYFMEKSLSFKSINDSIQGSQIHSIFFYIDEFLLEERKSNSRIFSEYFCKSFSLFCNTSFWHNKFVVRIMNVREYSENIYKRKSLRTFLLLFSFEKIYEDNSSRFGIYIASIIKLIDGKTCFGSWKPFIVKDNRKGSMFLENLSELFYISSMNWHTPINIIGHSEDDRFNSFFFYKYFKSLNETFCKNSFIGKNEPFFCICDSWFFCAVIYGNQVFMLRESLRRWFLHECRVWYGYKQDVFQGSWYVFCLEVLCHVFQTWYHISLGSFVRLHVHRVNRIFFHSFLWVRMKPFVIQAAFVYQKLALDEFFAYLLVFFYLVRFSRAVLLLFLLPFILVWESFLLDSQRLRLWLIFFIYLRYPGGVR